MYLLAVDGMCARRRPFHCVHVVPFNSRILSESTDTVFTLRQTDKIILVLSRISLHFKINKIKLLISVTMPGSKPGLNLRVSIHVGILTRAQI